MAVFHIYNLVSPAVAPLTSPTPPHLSSDGGAQGRKARLYFKRLSVYLPPPSISISIVTEARPPTPTAPVPLSISFPSVLPLLRSCLHLFFSSFPPLCPPTSARAAEQIKCDIACFIPELHMRWKLLFMTQAKSFFTVIPLNCCTMIREEPDMIMMRCDWE